MTHDQEEELRQEQPAVPERRGFLARLSGIAMSLGLIGGYGGFAAIAGRFLYPASATKQSWYFVAVLDEFEPGASIPYRSPTGARVNITRKGPGLTTADFSALSSVCPHLGCQVHWEAVNTRYFCPCHNGAFDAEGGPIAGPPKDANQSLSSFPLKIEDGLLFVQVPSEGLARLERPGGSDRPCSGRPQGRGQVEEA